MASQGQQALLAAAEERAKVEELSPSHGIENDPVVQQGRAKFKLCVEDMLLDYKHNSAVGIESCANTLIKVHNTHSMRPPDHQPACLGTVVALPVLNMQYVGCYADLQQCPRKSNGREV